MVSNSKHIKKKDKKGGDDKKEKSDGDKDKNKSKSLQNNILK